MTVPAALRDRCASTAWQRQVALDWPYASLAALLDASERAFDVLEREDWLQAFAAHARIGEPRADDPRGSAEQAGVRRADDAELRELRRLNAEYESRFGHTFLICASGLSAAQMLAALRTRIGNAPPVEFERAKLEQRKITALRLQEVLRP